MESPRPSVMLVCAGGSKGNGGMQSGEFPLKVHGSEREASELVGKYKERGSRQYYGGSES